jgi:hypothetical protein
MYVFHFMLVLDLRKYAVLRDFAFRFLFSLGDFSVLSLDLVDWHQVSLARVGELHLGFPHPP